MLENLRMLQRIGFYLYKYLGTISQFKYLPNGSYIYVKQIAGFTKDDLKITYTHNNLVEIEGHIIKKCTQTNTIIYEKRLFEIIQMPYKETKLSIVVKDGLLWLRRPESISI